MVTFEVHTNLDDIIPKWEEMVAQLSPRIKEGLDRATYEGQNFAIQLTSRSLPSGGGTYLERFVRELATRSGNTWRAKLMNIHPWAEAIEEGTSPHSGPFHVPPERVARYPFTKESDRRGWVSFQRHTGARAFRIFAQTRDHLARVIPSFFRRLIR